MNEQQLEIQALRNQVRDGVSLEARLRAQLAEAQQRLNNDRCNRGHKTLPLILWDCPACHEETRAKLAAAEKERDEARSALAVARDARDQTQRALDLTHSALDLANESRDRAQRERDAAKREAETMRELATQNANELNAAQRSYRAQIGELTRALAEEKKAHNEALRPDEYTRAAVACAEALADARVSYSDFEPIRERWQEIYTARQRGEPSAPVSSQPPARVLETWAAERMDGMTVGFDSAERALRCTGVIRAHRVALPVLKTVERGA
jgi:hypothetical protein